MAKYRKIRRIVVLRYMLRRWRARVCGCSSPLVETASSMLRRWRVRVCGWSSPPVATARSDVPKGHVAIYVGSSGRRFVVRTTHLNHPAFHKLFLQAEEEYGFSHPGPLCLPCEESLFFQILRQISSSYVSRFCSASDFDDPVAGCNSWCRSGGKGSWRADTVPLLRGNA